MRHVASSRSRRKFIFRFHPIRRIAKCWSRLPSIVPCTKVCLRKSIGRRNFSGTGSARASRDGFGGVRRNSLRLVREFNWVYSARKVRDRGTGSPAREPHPLPGIQPLHVIAHTVLQRKPRLVPERTACVREIGLCEVLIMSVWIVDVIRLEIRAQAVV